MVRCVRRYRAEQRPRIFDFKDPRSGKRVHAGPAPEDIMVCRMAQPATLRRLIDREQAPLPLSEPASLPALGLAVRQHMLDRGAQCSAAAAEAANPREALQDAFGSAAEAEGIADPDALGGDGGDTRTTRSGCARERRARSTARAGRWQSPVLRLVQGRKRRARR